MALWAFILGYIISSLIQVLVTRERMQKAMGKDGPKSIAVGTFFGFLSSTCSFSALSTTRALFNKGAGLAPSLAFMLASTNLVIELGTVIAIFLGWQFVVGEYVGSILVTWLLVRITHPRHLEAMARKKMDQGHKHDDHGESVSWKEKLTSRAYWQGVGTTHVMEWQMVWKDVLIGFTVAGIISAAVPQSFSRHCFSVPAVTMLPTRVSGWCFSRLWWLRWRHSFLALPSGQASGQWSPPPSRPWRRVIDRQGVTHSVCTGCALADQRCCPDAVLRNPFQADKLENRGVVMTFALSNMKISSHDLVQGERIADRHSFDGDNVSPDLRWSNLPEGTKSLAVFCHDPDAPLISTTGNYGFVHWLAYNIPPEVNHLPQGCKEYAQGVNNFDSSGYGGPKPPPGHGRHHYFFWVLALELEPALTDGLELAEFLEKVEPHVLGMNRLMAHYETRHRANTRAITASVV